MFDRAKSFVIQNGAFIENLYVKKVYRRSLRFQEKLREKWHEFIMDGADVWWDYTLISHYVSYMISKQLKNELELLSKMCIPQIFGVYKSNDTTGLVFHDDGTNTTTLDAFLTPNYNVLGTRRRCWEYMQNMQPLKRAAFLIGYIISNIYDHLVYNLEGSTGEIDFYIDSSGKLNAVLSIYIHDSQRDDYPRHREVTYDVMNTQKLPGDLPKSNFELLHKILNYDGIISRDPHYGQAQREIPLKFVICPEWYCDQDLFYQEPSRVNQFTRFKFNFKPDAITLATFNGNEYYKDLSFWTNYHISDSTSQRWLYHASQILKTYAIIHDNHAINYLGIVSGVRVQVDIPIFLSRVIRYVESNKDTEVYLFISHPGIDPVHGKVIEPHIFWSLDKSGTKPLTEFSAALKGLLGANVTMRPVVYHWDKFYYEGLYDLHKMCGIITSNVSRYVGPSKLKHNSKQEQLRNSPSYIEDAGINYLKTQHKLVKDREIVGDLGWPKESGVENEEGRYDDILYLKEGILEVALRDVSSRVYGYDLPLASRPTMGTSTPSPSKVPY
ncbi:hypothetical protein BDQ17DRAFT_1336766 [Cyathus striatus]|nr:hypothetical protein BDQ17DRAFT_1336766 [Cyathus striatus]